MLIAQILNFVKEKLLKTYPLDLKIYNQQFILLERLLKI